MHAAILRLRLWELQGDRLGAAALRVGDDGSASLARVGVLASSAVAHIVVEHDIHGSINLDIVLGWREGRGRPAGEAGAFPSIGRAADAVAAEAAVACTKSISLEAASAVAGEAGEVIVVVLRDPSRGQTREVPAGLLQGCALVVGVCWARKCRSGKKAELHARQDQPQSASSDLLPQPAAQGGWKRRWQ